MNVVVISGRLGQDVDLRVDNEGRPEGEFAVAVNEYMGQDADGKNKYWTTWVRCSLRGERARALQDQLVKGRLVTVHGQLRTKPYKINEEKTLPLTYVKVEEVEFDASRQKSDG